MMVTPFFVYLLPLPPVNMKAHPAPARMAMEKESGPAPILFREKRDFWAYIWYTVSIP